MSAALAVVQSTDAAYLLDLKRKVTLAQDKCEPARQEWIIDQGYYDGPGQWTVGEREVLRQRKQPALVFNEVKPAVNGIIGIVARGKTDPKAWGRSPKDTDSAEVATDCLRYVADINRFQSIRIAALKDNLVQGICCAVVEIDEKKEVKVVKGRPEDFFYDPYSRATDFSDARYMGLAPWMDEEDALGLVADDDPKREEKIAAIKSSVDSNGLETNASQQDRPKDGWAWADSKSRRLRVVQMWHRKGPIWHMCVFVSGGILEQGESPYKDADGRPTNQMIAQSAYVDDDNRRYGVVRDMRGPQDAENKGWSKAVHILSVAKLRVKKGTQDIDDVRREYAKPDGIIEANEGEVEEIGDKQLLPAHIEMLQIAEQKMKRLSPTPGIVGRQAQGQSGRAILAEQQAGMTEQALLLDQFDDWTLRIYRAIWACIKQFWDAPKYIRITDDENAPKYVMMNEPAVMMQPGPDGQPVPVVDPQTGQPAIDPNQPPRNAPGEMDVDIIIDSTPDTASLQEDQYKGLLELATVGAQTGTGTIPFEAVIEASALPRKRQILDRMEKAKEEAAKQDKQPGPAEIEQAKAEVQLKANDEKNQQNLAAHDAQLQRTDKADQDKANRQAMLEDQRFQNKQREMELTAHHAHIQRQADLQHSEATSQQSFDFKRKEGELKQGQKETKAAPMVGLSLSEAAETAIAQAQETSAQAMAQAAQSMEATAKSIGQIAEALSRPKRTVLRKDSVTGEKYAEQVSA